ncbi:patatin-like phospholipase family protein [Vibrio alfacsensis]|uniref:patatin-like phospholipase family protein n=1 Tax=Vibrio alfacsensis TaxID=1074311 RepID=UPI001CEDF7A9|nr:patatin-like phospholipase family protein [Vibrio alfacsensis]
MKKLLISILTIVLSACGTMAERNVSIKSESMNPLNESGLRFWDEYSPSDENYRTIEQLKYLNYYSHNKSEVNYLAISGGGVDGAFAAGILNAWTDKGDRPDFDVVTGISTGAIVSIFAFLGSNYDDELAKYYTQPSLNEIFKRNSLLKLPFKASIMNTDGFENEVRTFVDDTIISKIAAERDKGRILLIATTNLDNEKMSIWDIGRIAQIKTENSKKLIQDIIIASSSIPGLFPAKPIFIESDRVIYEELHVDGGVSRQVFLFPQWLGEAVPSLTSHKKNVYVIRNGQSKPKFEAIDNSISSISIRALSILTRRQGVGDVEFIYNYTKSNNMMFNFAHIDDDLVGDGLDTMSKDYMNAVYHYGYDNMLNDMLWLTTPPAMN